MTIKEVLKQYTPSGTTVGPLLAGSVPPPVRYVEGMRVRILQGESYHGMYVDRLGVIIREPTYSNGCLGEVTEGSVGVLLDDKWNENSKYGCYWFKLHEVQIITTNQEDNNNMLLLKGYNTIKVDIVGYGEQYVAFYGNVTDAYGHVVVTNGDKYMCGIVVDSRAHLPPNVTPKFQAVCPINDSEYLDRCEKARRAKEIEAKLKAAVKDYQQLALYEMLAEKSPEIAEMLKELKEISNV